MLALQEEEQQERSRVKEVEAALEDAYAQVDNLERQLNGMVKKMQRAATGLQFAINPCHKVSLLFTPAASSPTAPL